MLIASVTGIVTYSDSDGLNDLSSISISVPGSNDVVIPKASLMVSETEVSTTLDLSLATSGTRTFSIRAIDSAGNVSNTLSGEFEVGYNISRTTTLSGDTVSFTIPAGPPALPACAKLQPGRYVVTSTQYTGSSPCVPSGFTAITPAGISSEWTSLLGGNSACGIDGNGQVIRQALDFTNRFGTWGFSDTSTQSSYTISTSSTSLNGNDVLIESQLYCK